MVRSSSGCFSVYGQAQPKALVSKPHLPGSALSEQAPQISVSIRAKACTYRAGFWMSGYLNISTKCCATAAVSYLGGPDPQTAWHQTFGAHQHNQTGGGRSQGTLETVPAALRYDYRQACALQTPRVPQINGRPAGPPATGPQAETAT